MSRLTAEQVTLAYGSHPVITGLSLRIPDGAVTTIIGPNGCGKSTLLRALARLLRPRGGAVLLDGQAIHRLPTKQVARQLGLLSQEAAVPEALTVEELVERGRYPHQSPLQPATAADRAAVERALSLVGLAGLRHRPVDRLSGGQRQRAWIAMALAQETPILLLDEPTTYLDVAQQQEVLSLVQQLSRTEGRTVVMVLHDVNEAARASDHLVALRDGAVVAEGPPGDVLQPELLEQLFGVPCYVVCHPRTGARLCVPCGRWTEMLRKGIPVSTAERPPGDSPSRGAALQAEGLRVGYEGRIVVNDLSVSFPAGRVSAIIGPNGCGKSTLLKALARLLPHAGGTALLDGRPITAGSQRSFARRLAVLSQGAAAPPEVTVEELVAMGRFPHQTWYRQWSRADQEAVERALEATGLTHLRSRPLASLSGGQRQRAWLAMALAQETPVLLLDEPTTFLDVVHQVEVLDLVRELNRTDRKTIIMVLHDLSQASQYADYLVAMKDGRAVAVGTPQEVLSYHLVREVFGVESVVIPDPLTRRPLVLPGRSAAPCREPQLLPLQAAARNGG